MDPTKKPGEIIIADFVDDHWSGAREVIKQKWITHLIENLIDDESAYDRAELENIFISTYFLGEFVHTRMGLTSGKIEDACKAMKDRDSTPTFNATKGFADHLIDAKKKYNTGNYSPTNYYALLRPYCAWNGRYAELFCTQNSIDKNLNGSCMVGGLMGLDRILCIDANNTKSGDTLRSTMPREGADETFIQDAKERVALSSALIHERTVKLHPSTALQFLPSNSLDGIMLNNVNAKMVGGDESLESFWQNVKKAVKPGGIVFGYCTEIRPEGENYIIQENKGNSAFEGIGLTAFENKKDL